MTPEALRQLDEVIPFRIQQVKGGHFMSLVVLHASLDRVAAELGVAKEVRETVLQTQAPVPDCRTCASLRQSDVHGMRCVREHFDTHLRCANGDKYSQYHPLALWKAK